jgi:hypothetical protein
VQLPPDYQRSITTAEYLTIFADMPWGAPDVVRRQRLGDLRLLLRRR